MSLHVLIMVEIKLKFHMQVVADHTNAQNSKMKSRSQEVIQAENDSSGSLSSEVVQECETPSLVSNDKVMEALMENVVKLNEELVHQRDYLRYVGGGGWI